MERRKAGEREDQKYQRAGDDAGEVWGEGGGIEVETGSYQNYPLLKSWSSVLLLKSDFGDSICQLFSVVLQTNS
jgi:hypothetical protein